MPDIHQLIKLRDRGRVLTLLLCLSLLELITGQGQPYYINLTGWLSLLKLGGLYLFCLMLIPYTQSMVKRVWNKISWIRYESFIETWLCHAFANALLVAVYMPLFSDLNGASYIYSLSHLCLIACLCEYPFTKLDLRITSLIKHYKPANVILKS